MARGAHNLFFAAHYTAWNNDQKTRLNRSKPQRAQFWRIWQHLTPNQKVPYVDAVNNLVTITPGLPPGYQGGITTTVPINQPGGGDGKGSKTSGPSTPTKTGVQTGIKTGTKTGVQTTIKTGTKTKVQTGVKTGIKTGHTGGTNETETTTTGVDGEDGSSEDNLTEIDDDQTKDRENGGGQQGTEAPPPSPQSPPMTRGPDTLPPPPATPPPLWDKLPRMPRPGVYMPYLDENPLDARFLETMMGLAGESSHRRWQGLKLLGRGGYGKVGLWGIVGEDGYLEDACAVKEVMVPFPDHWNSTLFWKDPSTKKCPMEAYLHWKLRKSAYFVPYRGYSLWRGQRRYRLFYKVATYGDLPSFGINYVGSGDDLTKEIWLPTQFVYWVFYSLAQACLAMKMGSLEDDAADRLKWKEIIHMDLKPHNILLGHTCKPDSHPGWVYPLIWVTDLGLSIELPSNADHDIGNPVDYISRGTKGYYPPEGLLMEPMPEKPERLSEYTNVYGIGCIMWHLVRNKWRTPPYLATDEKYRMPENAPYATLPLHSYFEVRYNQLVRHEVRPSDLKNLFPKDTSDPYPHEMKELIRRCLEFKPGDRLEVIDLLVELGDQMKNHKVSVQEWEKQPPINHLDNMEDFEGKLWLPRLA